MNKPSISDREKPIMVFLEQTSNITSGETLPPIWQWLADEYTLPKNDSIDRAAISIINSILTHKLKYFAMSKKGIWDLMSQDRGHNQPVSLFSDRMYPKLLQVLYEKGFIDKVFKGANQFISDGYVVIDSDMLDYLDGMDIEEDKQYESLRVFCSVKGTSRGTGKGTSEGTKQDSKTVKIVSKQDRHLVLFSTITRLIEVIDMPNSNTTKELKSYLSQLNHSGLDDNALISIKALCNSYELPFKT